MRIMGLDVGSKTVGVAISDPLGFTAQGLEIIQINEEQGQRSEERRVGKECRTRWWGEQ